MCTEYKECSRCKKNLPATEEYFPKDSRRLNGLSSHCRTCNKFAVMKTRAKHLGLTFEEYLMQIERNKLQQKENAEKKQTLSDNKARTKEEKAKFKQEVKEAAARLAYQLKMNNKKSEVGIIYNGVVM